MNQIILKYFINILTLFYIVVPAYEYDINDFYVSNLFTIEQLPVSTTNDIWNVSNSNQASIDNLINLEISKAIDYYNGIYEYDKNNLEFQLQIDKNSCPTQFYFPGGYITVPSSIYHVYSHPVNVPSSTVYINPIDAPTNGGYVNVYVSSEYISDMIGNVSVQSQTIQIDGHTFTSDEHSYYIGSKDVWVSAHYVSVYVPAGGGYVTVPSQSVQIDGYDVTIPSHSAWAPGIYDTDQQKTQDCKDDLEMQFVLDIARLDNERQSNISYSESTIPNSVRSQLRSSMNYMNGYYRFVINVYKNNQLKACATIISPQNVNNPWQNVCIMADGFDPGNKRSIINIITNPSFNKLVQPTGETPIGKGYTICYVDFIEGAGDIRDNAKAMLKIIEKVCENAGDNKVTVGGFSMGGQVARLALLYGQQIVNGNFAAQIKNVKKFLSIDSPNKGASGVSVSFQNFLKRQQPGTYAESINNAASKQMLMEHCESTPSVSTEHDKFYSFLNSMGNFPKKMRLISIADANWDTPVHSGTSLKIEGKTAGIIKFDIDNCSWNESDFLAGSSLGGGDGVMNMLNSGVSDNNGWLVPFSWCLSGISGIPLMTKIKITESPNCDPTFMPITSVFGLRNDTPQELQNANSLQYLIQGKWTPFHNLYMTLNREVHITFNDELNSLILKALAEPDLPNNITPIINFLLSD